MMEILGNEDVRARLLALAEQDKLHHCLLFEGPEGLGKAAAARWLAMAVNCDPGPAMFGAPPRPCGQCQSCRTIAEDQHPDVLWVGLDPQRTAPIISVRQARELIGKLALRPHSARRRFVVIDPAEAMRPETANALLKTFEEPPQDTGFILICSSAQQLLPTVRSRSHRIRFRPIETQALSAWLMQQDIDEADWLAHMADGCPGRALALADGEAAQWRSVRDAMLDALDADLSGRFGYADTLTRAKKGRSEWTPRVEQVLDVLERMNRDALCALAGLPEARFYNSDRADVVHLWGQQLQWQGCQNIAAAIDSARENLAAFVNGRLAVDALLAQVKAELRASTQRRVGGPALL